VSREERRRALVLQFQSVSAERLSRLGRAWVEVEREKAGQQVDELFGELHTLKGEARVVGYRAAAGWLHELETLLAAARKRSFPPERALGEAVLGVLDAATDTFSRPPDPSASTPPAVAGLLERAGEALKRWDAAAPRPAPAAPPPSAAPAPGLLPPLPATPPSFLRVAREKVDGLSELTDQMLVLRAETTHAIPELRASTRRLESAVHELAPLLGPSAAWLAGAVRALAQQISDHEETLYRSGLAVESLDAAVREIRFVQASTLLDAYPRYVREMAVASGKVVQLELAGEGVEADRRVLEHLREPLLHLVRNAVDHGVETHDDRVKAGKPPAGTLRLSVAQRGGRLTVEAEDDGRGMDPGQLKERAVELGMINEAQARAMPEKEAMDLIFAAGFSMRRTPDETSGRGIGMDVVKRKVEQIGGRVEVESRPGQGTRVRLTAPLSVSVTRALLLEQGSETYAVPTSSVDSVRRIAGAEVEAVPGGRVLRHGDALLPVRRLWEEVRGAQGAPEICVVLRSGQDRVALLADAATREADLIVRPIEAPLGAVPLVAGAALMGSGRLVLLLEPAELVRAGEVGRGPGQPLPESRKLQILVVEDSVIFQATLSDLLRTRGHRVALASNGAEGLARAESVQPDLVITDIEMPRMNGLEMIRAMRAREALRKVPVITLSALGSREVRAEAMECGADHHLVKAELDEEYLLELVRSLTA
jgi:chemotaxis protein histidine kinase CheA